MREPRYSTEPTDPVAFTTRHDRAYTAWAGVYDTAVRRLPVWETWLRHALPHIAGPRVLEVSVGTGCLLTQYADRVDAHAVDLNRRMLEITGRNLVRTGGSAALLQANVEGLPYRDEAFDSLVCTMAFSGYPDGRRALVEVARVLRPGGTLILVDVGYPRDYNCIGMTLASLWRLSGDVIRDLGGLLNAFGLQYTEDAIGGSGSVYLYVATKPASQGPERPSRAKPGTT